MITFNLNGVELKISNGATIDEIANILQNFTNSYLYVDMKTGKLKGISEPNSLFFENTKLLEINNGFLLEEEKSKRKIKIFSRELLDNLDKMYSSSEEYETEYEMEYETVFRMYTAINDNGDKTDVLYVNSKIINILNQKNFINLEELIKLSFNTFLELRGCSNSNIILQFSENIYGEIKIITSQPLPCELIKEIERDALLELADNEIIYFLNLKESRLVKKEEEDTKASLSKLPLEFNKLIYDKLDDINENEVEFSFNGSNFKLKHEGEDLYSLYDKDFYFNYPHFEDSMLLNFYF